MARPKKLRGFTLVELLVVITIIGMLVSLLLPAIQAAREAGRRSVCQNNMRQCTLAMIQVAESKKAYPGYVNLIATGNTQMPYIRSSWVVPILPQLERNDLYQNWQKAGATLSLAQIGALPSTLTNNYYSPMEILICPSNGTPDLVGNPLSYAVNSGIAKTATDTSVPGPTPGSATLVPEDVNSGVFFNQSVWKGTTASAGMDLPGNGLKINQDFISTRDGTTYTLMMTENLQSGNWAVDPNNASGAQYNEADARSFYNTDLAVRENTAVVWFPTGNMNNATSGPVAQSAAAPLTVGTFGINDNSQLVTGSPLLIYDAMQAAKPSGLAYSRPSANHSGGVNVSYCGGNAGYLSEEIDYKVYTQLMTPNQKQVDVGPVGTTILAGSNTMPDKGWNNPPSEPFYILDESSF